ncbi:Insulin-like peptide receptor [Leptotrombidium deliense]|uniref:receptor protein-tyrosine kinase n=1 Tax=Leptotrombidium deliense TaxID=299467 RepID=A0A443SL79_9ACAR|nr:Insulin-like peptide receptor [Leptotrombidium deliense]
MFCYSNAHKQQLQCGSLDIRNTAAQLKKLENCTVIEGFLRIVLIDHQSQPEKYENYSFPLLTEITDYFLMNRVFGLHSIGKLFPNLAVIRGRELEHNYAFIVWDMQLQQIGLTNLMAIVRGNVFIEANPKLCYADTIDWNIIAPSSSHIIRNNRPRSQCQNCLSNKCPKYNAGKTPKELRDRVGDNYQRLCWNDQQCQTICPKECPNSCNQKNPEECCHESCIGGCVGPNNTDCIACKKLIHQNMCVDKCPPDYYEVAEFLKPPFNWYLERRCVSERECIAMSTRKRSFKVFNDNGNALCLSHCPNGYKQDPSNHNKCEKCDGMCRKVCGESYVNSIGKIQEMKGCTEINGSLYISIEGTRGVNIIKELEQAFKHLETIQGFLKISRSRPLTSLNFLKNLRLIEGRVKERNNYSLLIFDNENLQELFPFDQMDPRSKLVIESGRIFFHLNPKLCLKYIDELKNHTIMREYSGGKNWSDYDVSPHSNGEKVPCEVSKLHVEVSKRSTTVVVIKFDNFMRNMTDHRTLLGYLIYYKEAPVRNVTIYDGRDACGSSEWDSIDYAIDTTTTDDQQPYESSIVTPLQPFTQYALFIRTYTMTGEKRGAISDIIYFTTMPSQPMPPVNVISSAKSTNEIEITWNPPKKPNGNLTHYIVRVYGERDLNLDRNYCEERTFSS